jgi:hypothetical protein
MAGGATSVFNYSATDTNSAVNNVKLYYAVDGVNFSTLLKTLSNNGTSDSWLIPSDNTINARLKIQASDTSGNENTLISAAFTVDSILPNSPAIVINQPISGFTDSGNINATMSNCSDTAKVYISQNNTTPLATNNSWQDCSTAVGSIAYVLSSPIQGTNSLYSWAKDEAGNISVSSSLLSLTYDTIAPLVALTSAPVAIKGGTSYAITYSASDANIATNPISLFYSTDDGVTWNTIISNTSNSGAYNWTVPSIDNDQVKLKVEVVDILNHVSSSISATKFIIDSTPPTLDALSLNGGVTTTANNNVQVEMTAHDTTSKIKYFCLKYNNSTQPTASDACWSDVTAATPGIVESKNITFNNFYFQIGFVDGSIPVYAWVKDAASQVSVNSNTLNLDKFIIDFDSGTPPNISAIQVTNTDTPATPPASAEFLATSGTDIYVKWNASDAEGFSATPITLQYTTNDTSYVALSGGSNLLNGANGACTVSAGYTGCAKLVSPTNGYFKIKLIATDNGNITSSLSSGAMNETKLKIIAGNTDDGLNGSAQSAVFNVWGSQTNETYGVKNRLVVSDDGKYFYLDFTRGLLWVDPNTGVLKKFINVTGASSGDGGNVSAATLNQASAIALDAANRLLIWDNDRIRRVDLTTMMISTIVGGGTDTDPVGTVVANVIKLNGIDTKSGTFVPLPNRDIIFTCPKSSLHHRRYRAADGKVELMDVQGVGFTNYPTDIWTDKVKLDLGFVFDSVTSQFKFMAQAIYKTLTGDSYSHHSRIDFASGSESTIYPGVGPYDLTTMKFNNFFTGLDGNLYLINRFRYNLFRYNHLTNTTTNILGTGVKTPKPCTDNTLATSCAINIDSVFISKTGHIYFVDNNLIRTIDENNKVLTLFGQYPSFGNGELATTARFGIIKDLNMGKANAFSNKIVVQDVNSDEFREVTIDGNVNNLGAVNYSWHGTFSFDVDQITGDIFSPYLTYMRRLNYNTLTWSNIVGGTGTPYHTGADGLVGASVNLVSVYQNQTYGLIDNKLYYRKNYWTGTAHAGCYIKSYDASDSYRQAHFMGTGDCTQGSVLTGAAFNDNKVYDITKLNYFQDPTDSTDKFFFGYGNKIYKGLPGGNTTLFATLVQSMNSFTYKFNTDGLNLYYCSTTGYLYKYIYNTAQTVQLNWLSPTIKCKATRNIIYNSTRNSLIFPFTQNGLDGVAEYDLNP